MSKEDKARLPEGFLLLLDFFTHRNEVLAKRYVRAEASIKALSSAVSRLCQELQGFEDDDFSD